MVVGLVGAFGAAIAYGVASVLQYVAASGLERTARLDATLLGRLAGSWRYLLGLALDGVGFVLSLLAVRTLPLFVVQTVTASSLAVTAVVAALVLRTPFPRRDVVWLVLVVLGLTLTAVSGQPDASVAVGRAAEWGVLVATVLLVLAALGASRLRPTAGAAALGTVAGVAFGATSVAARMLTGVNTTVGTGMDSERQLVDLLGHPATYALVVAGLLGLLGYAAALQRGSVTQATAPLVVGETVVPALVGLALLGDRPRPGYGWVAVVGFALAVTAAVGLARHGEVRGDTGHG